MHGCLVSKSSSRPSKGLTPASESLQVKRKLAPERQQLGYYGSSVALMATRPLAVGCFRDRE